MAVAPRATKTIVNPSPKKSAPKNALNLGENLLLSAVSVFKFSKLSPDINDIYPGSSGKMQGDKNVKMPAIHDANIDGISDTNNISSVYILRINIIVTDCVGNI